MAERNIKTRQFVYKMKTVPIPIKQIVPKPTPVLETDFL